MRHSPGCTAALLALLATGCSTGPASPSSSTPPPSTAPGVASPSPSPSATDPATTTPTPTPTPAATRAGDLDASVFRATVVRWKAVPGQGDEGTYQPNGSWVHALDPAQVVEGLAMQSCTGTEVLPRPRHVLASDYEDPGRHRAVAQALRFRTASEASAFLAAYTSMVTGCTGKTNPMSATVVSSTPVLVDRRTMAADGTRWVEAVRATGTLVRMVAANEQDQPLTKAELAALAAAV